MPSFPHTSLKPLIVYRTANAEGNAVHLDLSTNPKKMFHSFLEQYHQCKIVVFY